MDDLTFKVIALTLGIAVLACFVSVYTLFELVRVEKSLRVEKYEYETPVDVGMHLNELSNTSRNMVSNISTG